MYVTKAAIATHSFYLISTVSSVLHLKNFEADKFSYRIDYFVTQSISRYSGLTSNECKFIFYFLGSFFLEKTVFDLFSDSA